MSWCRVRPLFEWLKRSKIYSRIHETAADLAPLMKQIRRSVFNRRAGQPRCLRLPRLY